MRQIPIGSRREGTFTKLNAQLDSLIKEKWAEFERETKLKEQFLRDEILELDLEKNFELDELTRQINQAESELERRLGKTKATIDNLEDSVARVLTGPVVSRDTDGKSDRGLLDRTPDTDRTEGHKRNRGFLQTRYRLIPAG